MAVHVLKLSVKLYLLSLQLMMDVVEAGKELMPHRKHLSSLGASQMETTADNSQAALPTSPIRKLTRNRGLVLLEESVIQQSLRSEGKATNPTSKRKLYWENSVLENRHIRRIILTFFCSHCLHAGSFWILHSVKSWPSFCLHCLHAGLFWILHSVYVGLAGRLFSSDAF